MSRNGGVTEYMSHPSKKPEDITSGNSIGTISNLSKMVSLTSQLAQVKPGQIMTVQTPSRVSTKSFTFKNFNANTEICEEDEDFFELRKAEREYKRRIVSLVDTKKLDFESRENLICKIKKICDTFELSDETFYNAVILNDFQSMVPSKQRYTDLDVQLTDLFDFAQISSGQEKCARYETFFKAVACIIISIKFYEYEKESPLTKEILEFFEIDNLCPLMKKKDEHDSLIDETKVIDVIYDYVLSKQLEILLKIDFKISPVNL